jgi:hypothetical protein
MASVGREFQDEPEIRKRGDRYYLRWGPYRIRMQVRVDGPLMGPISAEISLGKRKLATANGNLNRMSNTAKFGDIQTTEEATRSEGLRAIGILIPSLEHVLAKRGVDYMHGETHERFARFLEPLGYERGDKRGVNIRIKKELTKPPVLPVWARRRRKKRK